MQTIGLIGGITPQSTIMYYQVLNDLAEKKYGEFNSCKVIIKRSAYPNHGPKPKPNPHSMK